MTNESVDSLRLNTFLASALDRHRDRRVSNAFSIFTRAIATREKQTRNWLVHPRSQVWTKALPDQTWLWLERMGG